MLHVQALWRQKEKLNIYSSKENEKSRIIYTFKKKKHIRFWVLCSRNDLSHSYPKCNFCQSACWHFSRGPRNRYPVWCGLVLRHRRLELRCFIRSISVMFVAATDRLGPGRVLPPCSGVQRPCSLEVLQGPGAARGLSGKTVSHAPVHSGCVALVLLLICCLLSQLGYSQNPILNW